MILAGSRVLVFDHTLYVNDIKTPLSVTMRSATVISRYGFISKYIEKEHGREAAKYPDCCDVIFDHSGRVSRVHFTNYLKEI